MSKSKQLEIKQSDDSIEVYTEEELALLDKYHKMTNSKFDDDEIYDIMVKSNFDEKEIGKVLSEMMRDLKKGEDYEWHEIGKKKVKKNEEKKSHDYNTNKSYKQKRTKGIQQSEMNQNKENINRSYKSNPYKQNQYYNDNQQYNNGYQYNYKNYNGYDEYYDYNGNANGTQWSNNKRRYNKPQAVKFVEVEVSSPSVPKQEEERVTAYPKEEEGKPINSNGKEENAYDDEEEDDDEIFIKEDILIPMKEEIRVNATKQSETNKPIEQFPTTSFAKMTIESMPIEKSIQINPIQKQPEVVKPKEKELQLSINTNATFTLEKVPLKEAEQPKDYSTQPNYQPQMYPSYNAMPYMMMPYMMPEDTPNGSNSQMNQPMYYPYLYYPMMDPSQQIPQPQRNFNQPPMYNQPRPLNNKSYIPNMNRGANTILKKTN